MTIEYYKEKLEKRILYARSWADARNGADEIIDEAIEDNDILSFNDIRTLSKIQWDMIEKFWEDEE